MEPDPDPIVRSNFEEDDIEQPVDFLCLLLALMVGGLLWFGTYKFLVWLMGAL